MGMDQSLGLDAILPAQFYLPRPGPLTGEAKLMLAVLEEAWRALRCGNPRVEDEAEAWLRGDDEDFFFSFPQVCQILNLGCHIKIRQQMLAHAMPRRIHRGIR